MSEVHVLVPDDIDDPARPSGGNWYDRRICGGLAALGWTVRICPVAGDWPWPDVASREAMARLVGQLPDGAVVLVDGLIASTVPDVLVPQAGRLRLVVLMHMPLGTGPLVDGDVYARERRVLAAAAAVVTTSWWTRRRLLGWYALAPERVFAAHPGVDPAGPAPGSATGGHLLTVAALIPNKGHDVLLAALAKITEKQWDCTCVGRLDRDPDFVARLRRQADDDGIGARLRFAGALTGADLDAAYGAADVLVLASHTETYGMVVTEALARGIPVIASAVGGVPEALGRAPDGGRPGLLVPPGDPAALAIALGDWLDDTDLRESLREAARGRRTGLSGWPETALRISTVLAEAAAG